MATFFNQATLTYNNTVTSSNVVTGELLEVLSVTKTAVPDVYTPDDAVTYVISIVNAGPAAYNGLTVTDDLGAYPVGATTVVPLTYNEGTVRYYVNGVLQTAPATTVGDDLVFEGIGVPAGGNAILIYSATVNGFAPPTAGGEIVNTVTVNGNISTPAIATETIIAESEPRLAITKSISPDAVVENGQLTYTFVIQNSGNTAADAADNLVVTDTFDPILTITSVTYNGVVLSDPTDYTYDEATGLFRTVAGRLTVDAATFTQDETGRFITIPGIGVLTITGTV
jgi:uncharacterized repeat protein (TIGR01451 family)